MSLNQVMLSLFLTALVVGAVYSHSGWTNIKNCFKMWFTREYWTDYNIVEAASWFTKAIIIVPGLVFGIQVWQLYLIALFTSASLIWASNKKLLPTLVGFNTLWIWLSTMVIAKHLIS
jgi:hypothetical protein